MILPKVLFYFILTVWLSGLAFSLYNIVEGKIEYWAYVLGFNLWAVFGLMVVRNTIRELMKVSKLQKVGSVE